MDSLVSILHIDPNSLKEIHRSIHSIKGNASLLAFKAFAEQAHSFEDKINELEQKDKLLNLIFEQGFSTKENADLISGRGIGLDIVNEKVKSRNGTINVLYEEGKFCEFRISIPQSN